MKRILYIIFLLFIKMLSPAVGFGQIDSYGFKAGIQTAGAYSNPPMDGRVLGFSLYGFTDLDINGNFFSTIDLGITQRGFSNSQLEINDRGEVIQKVNANTKILYVSLAPYLNVKTKFTKYQTYVGIGPRLDLMVYKSPGLYKFTSAKIEDPTADKLDKVIVFGGSFVTGIRNLSFRNLHFRIEAKYETDITDSFSEFSDKYKNNSFMVTIGFNL